MLDNKPTMEETEKSTEDRYFGMIGSYLLDRYGGPVGDRLVASEGTADVQCCVARMQHRMNRILSDIGLAFDMGHTDNAASVGAGGINAAVVVDTCTLMPSGEVKGNSGEHVEGSTDNHGSHAGSCGRGENICLGAVGYNAVDDFGATWTDELVRHHDETKSEEGIRKGDDGQKGKEEARDESMEGTIED